jgi:hypothetical protein
MLLQISISRIGTVSVSSNKESYKKKTKKREMDCKWDQIPLFLSERGMW